MLEEPMKNKMLAMALAAILALGAVACGGGDAETDTGTDAGASEGAEVTS
jgi:uncharacterized membrane protein